MTALQSMTAPLRPWRRGARDRRRWTPLVTHPPNQRWRLRHGDHRSDPVLEPTERVWLLDLVAGWLPTSHRNSATRYRGPGRCRSASEL